MDHDAHTLGQALPLAPLLRAAWRRAKRGAGSLASQDAQRGADSGDRQQRRRRQMLTKTSLPLGSRAARGGGGGRKVKVGPARDRNHSLELAETGV